MDVTIGLKELTHLTATVLEPEQVSWDLYTGLKSFNISLVHLLMSERKGGPDIVKKVCPVIGASLQRVSKHSIHPLSYSLKPLHCKYFSLCAYPLRRLSCSCVPPFSLLFGVLFFLPPFFLDLVDFVTFF